MRHRHLPIALLLAACACSLAAAGPALADGKPSKGALYADGPTDRYLLGGQWLVKDDRLNVGLRHRYFNQRGTGGWSPIEVPGVTNATDPSNDSFLGGVVWYRRSFTLPSSSKSVSWIIRFESVNYRATVYLNGKKVGQHQGSYIPFELNLTHAVRRRGTNRLVVRVDSRRQPNDLPPSGFNSVSGLPTGGWWNYTGLNREVYLRGVQKVAFTSVQTLPDVPDPSGATPARIDFRVAATNYDKKAQRVSVGGTFGGQAVRLRGATIGAHRTRTLFGSISVPSPHLWSLSDPFLYRVSLTLRAGGRTADGYSLQTGIRSIKLVNGVLQLNGHSLNLRGVGLHEDSPDKGNAIDNAKREADFQNAKDLGATLIRSHYPLHPYFQELADKMGMLLWSEIPVYSLRSAAFARPEVRKQALSELATNITSNGSHPSVMLWSIGNELAFQPNAQVALYLRQAATQSHRLDPTRPVGLAILGYPQAGCQGAYDRLDVIGVNEYFGWYFGQLAQLSDRDLLSAYLDSVHACYPGKGLIVTEFGAEANRAGPVDEKGTFEFQQDYVKYHLGVFATKPYLSGAIYWGLQEFKVRPAWDGGNPRPTPPLHTKGLITFDGATRKPAFFDVQRVYTGSLQVLP
ncbi:MAG TPA: glycoside hydrolase family 2 TIM barrel-domain containing protein [Solirubrobacteraceae bacterium]|nr:glycoside hydrolase family 2 TIM barrel-domain containing protein [Solirubrobacteraceae bacterium]